MISGTHFVLDIDIDRHCHTTKLATFFVDESSDVPLMHAKEFMS
jgi:hypothetical protein